MEQWAGGPTYERYMGRWSRLAAQSFITWLNHPSARRWLDVGCGTGALTTVILAQATPQMVCGVDLSPLIRHIHEQHAHSHGYFSLADGAALPWPAGLFDAVVSGLALNFMPDPAAALAEMCRVTAQGGIVALYVWDYAGGMAWLRYFWDAAVALDPAAAAHDEGSRFPLCQPGPLRALLAQSGLQRVEVVPLDIVTHFASFDDYWQPFLSGAFPGPAYVAALPEDGRAALRDRLRATLPTAADGTIALTARAWAARGYKIQAE